MLKVSISGVRGLWSQDLTPEVTISYIRAFVEVLRGRRASDKPLKILVGSDTRPSSPPLKMFVCSLLQRWGVSVIDLGVSPTPVVLFSVRHLSADGGIVLTASHNPIEWNAFKFVGPEGLFFTKEQMELLEQYQRSYETLPSISENIGTYGIDASLIDRYLDVILPYFPISEIRKSGIKVVADAVNGTAASFFPILMQRLEIQYSLIHQDPSRTFERNPEPRAENLAKLSEKVRIYKGSYIGFAFDPDGDRLALMDEDGNALGENWTLGIAYLCFLKYHDPKNRDIVANLSTSILLEEIAKQHSATVHRTPVGEIHVTQKLLQSGIEIGGEGNGGVILPALNPCRDSIVACLLILEYLAREKRALKSIPPRFPKFYPFSTSIKNHGAIPSIEDIMIQALSSVGLAPSDVNRDDGIRMSYSGGWIHVRPSNTEPILRIMGESEDLEKQDKLVELLKNALV